MGRYRGSDAIADLTTDYNSTRGQEDRSPASVVDTAKKLSRKRKAKSAAKAPVKEASASMDSGSGDMKSAIRRGAMQSLSSSGGGGAMDTAGSALMMSGNPYAMAAGGALKVIGAVKAKKERAAQAAADAENSRRQRLASALSQLGSGVGTLGMV